MLHKINFFCLRQCVRIIQPSHIMNFCGVSFALKFWLDILFHIILVVFRFDNICLCLSTNRLARCRGNQLQNFTEKVKNSGMCEKLSSKWNKQVNNFYYPGNQRHLLTTRGRMQFLLPLQLRRRSKTTMWSRYHLLIAQQGLPSSRRC